MAPSPQRQPPGREGHQTSDHRCTVERCRVKRDHACAHVVAKCRNCSGTHLSQASVCPVKREARRIAKGWRSPSPPQRERRASAPLKDETPGGPGRGSEGEMEVEVQPGAEAGREEMAK